MDRPASRWEGRREVKTLTIYVAEDGEEFYNQDECERYEAAGCVHFEPLPKYGDHVPLTKDALRWMLSGDGDCYYATATHRSRKRARGSAHPKWATHLVYFGK